jgi:hypothetical protein
MRFWHAAAFLLIACGGKIASESTGSNGPGPGLHPGAGDDDDDPGYTSSTSGAVSSSSGSPGTSSGYVPPPYPYPGSSTSSTSGFGGSSSSSGTLCGNVSMGCGGDGTSYKCSIDGPPGTPSLQCFGDTGDPVAKCNCYGTYLDSGTGDFVLKLPKQPRPKDLYTAWQKYCGGTCN